MTHTTPQIVLRRLTGRPLVQALQVVRYQAGQEFAAHMDSVPSSCVALPLVPSSCVALPVPLLSLLCGYLQEVPTRVEYPSIKVVCALLPAPWCKGMSSGGAVFDFEC